MSFALLMTLSVICGIIFVLSLDYSKKPTFNRADLPVHEKALRVVGCATALFGWMLALQFFPRVGSWHVLVCWLTVLTIIVAGDWLMGKRQKRRSRKARQV